MIKSFFDNYEKHLGNQIDFEQLKQDVAKQDCQIVLYGNVYFFVSSRFNYENINRKSTRSLARRHARIARVLLDRRRERSIFTHVLVSYQNRCVVTIEVINKVEQRRTLTRILHAFCRRFEDRYIEMHVARTSKLK